MSLITKIEWTDATWNVAVGCSKVSPGCKYCYMMRDFEKRPQWEDVNGTVYRTAPATFNKPLEWQAKGIKAIDGRPLKVFTCSLTDLFHPQIDEYREKVWDIIRACPDLIFQILTKRPERADVCLPPDWGPNGYENVWMGVSVENQKMAEERISLLHNIPAAVKFLSVEPLLEPIEFSVLRAPLYTQKTYCPNCDKNVETWNSDCVECVECNGVIDVISKKIDWVIIGGESGNDTGKWRYRSCQIDWLHNMLAECREWEVPVFVKQLGTHIAKSRGMSDRKGGDISEFPPELQIREFPKIYDYANPPR